MSQGGEDTCPPKIYLNTFVTIKVPTVFALLEILQGDPMMYVGNQGAKIIMRKSKCRDTIMSHQELLIRPENFLEHER